MCNVSSYQVIWMHHSHFERAIQINKDLGFMHQNRGWLERLYQHSSVFSMAVYAHSGTMLGWSTYRKTSSGIELLWMVVPLEYQGSGIGTSMIDRLKGWLDATPNRRGALTCSVHEYSDDMLYFLRSRGFECIKINSASCSYRMCFVGEEKRRSA